MKSINTEKFGGLGDKERGRWGGERFGLTRERRRGDAFSFPRCREKDKFSGVDCKLLMKRDIRACRGFKTGVERGGRAILEDPKEPN